MTNFEKIVTAPKKTGNPYFDAMECPLDVLPETFIATYRDSENQLVNIEVPTKECFVPGSWLARRYAGITEPKLIKYLNSIGIYPKATVWGNNGIVIQKPKY